MTRAAPPSTHCAAERREPAPGRTMGLFLRTASADDEAYAELGRVVTKVAQEVFDAQPV